MTDMKKINDEELEEISGGTFSPDQLAQLALIQFKFEPGDKVLVKGYENYVGYIMTCVRSLDGPKYKVKLPALRRGWISVAEADLTFITKGTVEDTITIIG